MAEFARLNSSSPSGLNAGADDTKINQEKKGETKN